MSNDAKIARIGVRSAAGDAALAISHHHFEPVRDVRERFPLLELSYDSSAGILWNFMAPHAPPHFSTALLNDLRSFQDALIEAEDLGLPDYNPEHVRYVVLGSRVPNVFNLGGDLNLFRELISRGDRRSLAAYAKKAIDAVYLHSIGNGLPLTTISLVQGVAMGGGFEAALAGQVIIAERGVRFGLPEVIFGLFPGMGAYTLLRRRVDAKTAERMIVSADTYSAEQLFELGVIDELVYPGEGEQAVMNYVARQRMNPGQHAFRQALNRVNAIHHDELYGITDHWVDEAMKLTPANLRRIDRLLRMQAKFVGA